MAGLNEYKNAHPETAAAPLPEAQAMQDTVQEIAATQKRREDADRAKESVLLQLEQGNAPQLILYTAVKAIGLYSNDPEWTEAAQGYFNRVYADIMQESFLADNAAIAAKRLEEMKAEYIDKLSRQLEKDARQYSSLHKAAVKITEAIEGAQAELCSVTTVPPSPGAISAKAPAGTGEVSRE